MGWERLPTMEEYKISLVVEGMDRIAANRTSYTKEHLAPARAALDEICRTADYDFGIVLFKQLEKRFTDLQDDLGYMRQRIQDLKEALDSQRRQRRRSRFAAYMRQRIQDLKEAGRR